MFFGRGRFFVYAVFLVKHVLIHKLNLLMEVTRQSADFDGYSRGSKEPRVHPWFQRNHGYTTGPVGAPGISLTNLINFIYYINK
jgi:hypothetical protein